MICLRISSHYNLTHDIKKDDDGYEKLISHETQNFAVEISGKSHSRTYGSS
jgi:hypothetical protein